MKIYDFGSSKALTWKIQTGLGTREKIGKSHYLTKDFYLDFRNCKGGWEMTLWIKYMLDEKED